MCSDACHHKIKFVLKNDSKLVEIYIVALDFGPDYSKIALTLNQHMYKEDQIYKIKITRVGIHQLNYHR